MNPFIIWTQTMKLSQMHAVGAKLLWYFPSNSFVIARILVQGILVEQHNLSTALFISNLNALQSYFLSVKIRPFLP